MPRPARLRRLLAVAAAAAVATGTAAVAAPHPGHGREHSARVGVDSRELPLLGHAGRWTVDPQGRVVVLHGFNMVAKLPPYDPAAAGFGDDDAAFLQAHGFTTVRLGVIWKRLEPKPEVFDDSYLASLAGTVDTLARHGIYTLLDFHQDMWNERFQGEGAPDWAVVDDGLAAAPAAGFPGNYFAMPALWRAFDHFWNNDTITLVQRGGQVRAMGLQDLYASAWQHVASYFASDSAVLGYDLLNEPFPGSQWYSCLSPAGCPVFDQRFLAPFVHKVLTSIRSVDQRHLVYYEPQLSFDFSAATSIGDPGDARSAFAFHAYCAAAVGAPETPATRAACDQVEDRTLRNADQQAATSGDALLLTEWGATDDRQELQSMAAAADRHMDSWQEWTYVGGDPSAPRPAESIVIDPRKPPTGSNVKWDKLRVLERPYPRVIGGTPQSWGFDPTSRVFRFVYSTMPVARPGSPFTLVSVPRIQYPRGYTVTARGARVASRTRDPTLVLYAPGPPHRVVVTVSPG